MQNVNILNFFKKERATEQALSFVALSVLPALFVVKTLETGFIYSALLLIYVLLATLIGKLINKIMPRETHYVATLVGFAAAAVLVKLIGDVIFFNFLKTNALYIYLFVINPIPYVILKNNEDSMKETFKEVLATILGVFTLLLSIGLVREVLGTGTITIGNYLSFINKNVISLGFEKYAIGLLTGPVGAFMLLGFALAIFKVIFKEEVKA